MNFISFIGCFLNKSTLILVHIFSVHLLTRVGHILHHDTDDNSRRALYEYPQGLKRRGAPWNTWRLNLVSEIYTIDHSHTMRSIAALATDRQSWREILVPLMRGQEKLSQVNVSLTRVQCKHLYLYHSSN